MPINLKTLTSKVDSRRNTNIDSSHSIESIKQLYTILVINVYMRNHPNNVPEMFCKIL